MNFARVLSGCKYTTDFQTRKKKILFFSKLLKEAFWPEQGCKSTTFFRYKTNKILIFFQRTFLSWAHSPAGITTPDLSVICCGSKRLQTYNLFSLASKRNFNYFSENFFTLNAQFHWSHNACHNSFCCFSKRVQIYALFLIPQALSKTFLKVS